MLALPMQSEIVSLVNDFHDLSIRNDVSYGSHKVSGVYANDDEISVVRRHVA
jgi:hypothetical protein